YKKLGMYPGQTDLKEQGGLNSQLYNAIYENNPKNGVLTAVEDFIDESDLEFSFKIINAFHGLGILFPNDDKIENIIKNVIKNANLLDNLEKERIKLKISNSGLKNQINLVQRKLNENEIKAKHINNQLSYTKNKLKQKESLIKKLNTQINNLSNCFYELEYLNNKNRSISQQLVSKFPSLFIILKSKVNFKRAFVNIKGYKAIKRNKLVDIGFYLRNNKSIRLSGMDPILHYMYHGFKEGKKPNPVFDGDYYLKKYKDVKKSNLNPLVHYSLYGIKEGRKTRNLKNPEKFYI
ncbi:MAG: hypothetical protein ACPK7R_09975, partial [Methanobacterium sp.]